MLGKTLVSRFKISSELGHGGFGQTFIAEDMHLPGHPKCAIEQLKTMDTHPPVLDTLQRFKMPATLVLGVRLNPKCCQN